MKDNFKKVPKSIKAHRALSQPFQKRNDLENKSLKNLAI